MAEQSQSQSSSPVVVAGSGGSSPRPRAAAYTIGYAMLPNKHDTFVQPSFIDLAAQHGIRLVALDPSRPLAEQGPLDLVVHKLYGQAWRAQLEAFSALHPDVPIIDPPAAIDRILDRFTMLNVVSGLDSVAVPRQVMVHDAGALQQAAATADDDDGAAAAAVLGGLRFPLVAKPVEVDGSAASHDLCLVYRREGLRGLRPPLVLQEFANHGGVLFKVYVVGDRATCVVRSSLPDVPPERLQDLAADAAAPFANISLLAPAPGGDEGSEKVAPPPQDFVDRVAREIRRAVGLHLINFDLIRTRDAAGGAKYLVLDINYCPGYSKMPGFEPVLTEFFLEMLRTRGRNIDERPAPGAEARQAEAEPSSAIPSGAKAMQAQA